MPVVWIQALVEQKQGVVGLWILSEGGVNKICLEIE